ncbi:hypothetical protein [Cytobacillus firmus]|uniref:hypothetical protein n=1 Tax=Cytobacillus firmus TaxID=1399 RepID=UPI0018CE7235|nr:hypothetical protein [Cytobacillus firmus]MBG9547234.1 hypothetical protein [Cytobacillus firmus]MBG9604654.1 hypothetical protein [Cytobacillus firmus]MED1941960.1 hypothetical protein [Cytobacillus firmus]
MQHLPMYMSDMRSAYNRIYRIDADTGNPMEQQQFLFYTGNDSKSQKPAEAVNEEEPKKDQKAAGNSFTRGKTKSFPLILPPPSVESSQIIKTSELSEKAAEKDNTEKESVPPKDKTEMTKPKKFRLPKQLNDMLTPFSPMLSWSPSLPSKYSNQPVFTKSHLPGGSDEKGLSRPDAEANLNELMPAEKFPGPAGNPETRVFEEKAEMQKYNASVKDPEETDLTQEFLSMLDGGVMNETSEETELNNSIPKAANKQSESAMSLEDEFADMLDLSFSTENESDYLEPKQDEAFALILESGYDKSESSDHDTGNHLECEESSSEREYPILKEPNECDFEENWQANQDEESSSYEGEFSLMLKKACSILDKECEDTPPLQEKFLALLDESSDQSNSCPDFLKEELFMESDCKESESAAQSEEATYKEVSSLLDYFSAMLQGVILSEVSEHEEEESISETEERVNPVSDESEASAELSDDLFDMLEESSSSSSLLNEEEPSPCCCECFRNELQVKLPVLKGKAELDFTLFDFMPFPIRNGHISKMEWSVDSLQCSAILPSKTIFIKGTLMADILFVTHSNLQNIRMPVSIDKTIELEWISPPQMPASSNKKEFMYIHENRLDHHYEYFQEFTEEITCKLKSIRVLWHGDAEDHSGLEIMGKALLSLDFFQEQIIQI